MLFNEKGYQMFSCINHSKAQVSNMFLSLCKRLALSCLTQLNNQKQVSPALIRQRHMIQVAVTDGSTVCLKRRLEVFSRNELHLGN